MSQITADFDTSETVTAKSHGWQVLLVFSVIAVCLYWPSLQAPFIFDDGYNVSTNPHIKYLWPADWLTKESRPVGQLSFALNYQFTGMSVAGFHLTNTGIHVLAAWILFLLLSYVLPLAGKDALDPKVARILGFAAALIWLVHPLNTQAVSYICQRYESLMGLFFLTTLYCLARGSQAETGFRKWWYLGALLVGSLGMGTKQVMVAILFVGPLFDRAFLAHTWREVGRQRGWIYAGLVPALIGTVYLDWQTLSRLSPDEFTSAGFGMTNLTPWKYLRSQSEVILHYIGLAILPRQLIFDYGWPVQRDLVRAGIAGAVVLTMLLGSAFVYLRRPRWGIAGLSFFLILAPTSSCMPIADLAFEHRMYLPLISVCVGVVFLGYAWLERLIATESIRQRCVISMTFIAVLLLGLRTYVRNEDYRQPVRLFAQCVQFNPMNPRAHDQLAGQLELLGLVDQAREQYVLSTKVRPSRPYAYNFIGMIDAEKKDFASALEYFNKYWSLQPTNQRAGYSCGLCYMELGRDRESVAAFERVLEIKPFDAAQRELAWVLATSADPNIRDGGRALELVQSLLESRSDDPRLLEVLAAAEAEVGNFDRASAFAENALERATTRGWSESKRAALTAALNGYLAQHPLRREAAEREFNRS